MCRSLPEAATEVPVTGAVLLGLQGLATQLDTSKELVALKSRPLTASFLTR